MGRHPIPFIEDVLAAWDALQRQGGSESLPPVVRRRDLAALFPKMHRFDLARRAGIVPGDQLVPGGVWRVERETFVEWLRCYLSREQQEGSTSQMLYQEDSDE